MGLLSQTTSLVVKVVTALLFISLFSRSPLPFSQKMPNRQSLSSDVINSHLLPFYASSISTAKHILALIKSRQF